MNFQKTRFVDTIRYLVLFSAISAPISAQVVRSTGDRTLINERHDGGLRPVVGVHEYALFRPTKSTASNAGPLAGHAVYNTTFNHHPFLTYWNGRFYATFIGYDGSSSRTSTEGSKRLRLQWSTDGRTWNNNDAADVFPTPLATHQRTAFFIASNGKLLVSTWFSERGEGNRGEVGSRLVREINGPNNFGPILTLKHNVRGASNAGYPLYTTSSDAAFRSAAQELFDDPLERQARWEEDRDTSHAQIYDKDADPLYTQNDHEAKAFQWYRLANGRIVSFWKGGYSGVTSGDQWIRNQITMDLDLGRFGHHRNAKTWGEPLTTGRYGLVANRSINLPNPYQGGSTRPFSDVRTPLTITTSADGFLYDSDYLAISGDCGPQLYRNAAPTDNKAVGASYTRGLTFVANRENKTRPNDNMWVTYSTNKEYIWVTEIPKEVSATVANHVNDDLTGMAPGGRVGMWNIRSSAWGSVRLVSDGSGSVLRFSDKDRYDYARAVRVFPESGTATVTARVRPQQTNTGEMQIELMDKNGKRPVRIRFDSAGNLQRFTTTSWSTLTTYAANTWYDLSITCDTVNSTWTISVNGTQVGGTYFFSENVGSVERVEFRTGDWRMDDFSTQWYGPNSPGDRTTALANADTPVTLAAFDVSSLQTTGTPPTQPTADLVTIASVSNGKTYTLGSLGNGERPYIDRSFTINSVPSTLAGSALIRTANDDEFLTGSNHLNLTIGRPAEVHVYWSWSPNDMPLALPTWMAGFTANPSLDITTTDNGRVYRSFSKTVSPSTLTLGGNDRNTTGSQASYFVVIKESSGANTTVATAILPDGSIRFGDDDSSYGNLQDGQNSTFSAIAVSPDRTAATLAGNAWKIFPINYNVTANTRLAVTVQGSNLGEISGVALDDDTNPTSGLRAFLFGGSEVTGSAHTSWATTLPNPYTAGAPAMTYVIRIGDTQTGSVNHLGLIGDSDGGINTDMTFSNLRIYEEGAPSVGTFADWQGTITWGSIPAVSRDENSDPDGDGYSNRLERALGMDPTTSDLPSTYSLKAVQDGNGSILVTLRYRKHAPDEIYELVHSPNLEVGSWETTGASSEQYDSATDRHFRTWAPVAGEDKGFVRMRLRVAP